MQLNLKIISILIGLMLPFMVYGENDTLQYSIMLRDPLQPDLPARPYQVVLSLDEKGYPESYRLFLENYVCLEETCKPIAVTLHWNAIGEYLLLEYPDSHPLTKTDHVEFTSDDYSRLDEILKDNRSILGMNNISVFTVSNMAESRDIDAVSSATPQEIADAVVEDAAYTSWTLWHWVNGEIVDKLVEHTLTFCDRTYLLHCLNSDDPQFINLALRQTGKLIPVDHQIREVCFEILRGGNWNNSQLALQILTNKPEDPVQLHLDLVSIFGENAGSGELILNYFENYSDINIVVWEKLAEKLRYVSNYSDVFAALTLLKRHAGNSGVVRSNVEILLESDNPYISERAKEFLEHE